MVRGALSLGVTALFVLGGLGSACSTSEADDAQGGDGGRGGAGAGGSSGKPALGGAGTAGASSARGGTGAGPGGNGGTTVEGGASGASEPSGGSGGATMGGSSSGGKAQGGNGGTGGSGDGGAPEGGAGGTPKHLTWVRRCLESTCSSPGPRSGVTAAFEPVRGEVLMYGGTLDTTVFAETWAWNGTTWTERCPTATCTKDLGPRQGAAAALDTKRKELVLATGLDTKNSDSCHDDSYTWDGTTWTFLGSVGTARYSPGIAYDAARDLTVMFGGACAGTPLTQTLGFDGTAWTDLCTEADCVASQPTPRWGMAMAYDAAHEVTLLFGGTVSTSMASDETFAWDGSSWHTLSPATKPSPRSGARMVYDSVRKRIVLFGGTDFTTMPTDTWEWDGENWSRLDAEGPEGRHRPALAFDPERGVVVLFGGADDPSTSPLTALGDTWELVAE